MKPRMMIVMVGPAKGKIALLFADAANARAICGMAWMPKDKARQWLADWVSAGKPLVTTREDIEEGVMGASKEENPFAFLAEAQPEQGPDWTALPVVHDDTPTDIRLALSPPLPDGRTNVIQFPAHPTLN